MNSLFSATNRGGGQLGQFALSPQCEGNPQSVPPFVFALGPHNPLGGPELIFAKEVGESR